MSWASVSPTVLPLAGVVIGAGSTVLGQHLAVRRDVRREAEQRAANQRAERKDAITGFLSVTQRVEQHLDQLRSEPGLEAPSLFELMHAVWLAKKIIELVCSGALAQAAQDYTLELSRTSHEAGSPDEALAELDRKGTGQKSPASSAREQRLREEFMEAARREMGYSGEPLLRRTRAEAAESETVPSEASEWQASHLEAR